MKKILIKSLIISLVVVVVILGILLVFALTMGIGWPWWVGFFILIGILGVGLGVVFFKKLWRKRQEQQFVGQVIEQDEQSLRQLTGKERDHFKELQGRWKEAVGALKRSHLKKYGNPLYVLPWYMVIGESGSGKTTAIQSAQLSSPFAEVSRTSGISGTRNCDWWFFEQAILIDTAGRYAIPVDEGRDKQEWEKFLNLLAKFSKKESLNGLVVTIPADKLQESEPAVLQDDGKSIRRRLDELMRVLGAKFPVYVLITKCDLVQGMSPFCDHLPETGLNQAMGVINQSLSTDIKKFLKHSMRSIGERIRDYRLLILHKPHSPADPSFGGRSMNPEPLLFPEEFERLEPGLTAFIGGAFQENPYQETPILRGIYFSSGRQEGTPYSHFLKELGLIEEREVLPGTTRGFFLHDFFSKILPKDRGLFAPTQRALDWSRLTKNLGLTSWLAVGIAVCGLLSYAFVKNLRTMGDIGEEFPHLPVLQGDIYTDIDTMERFRQVIITVEERNRGWWIPRFGLDESLDVETQLKKEYCDLFKEEFLIELDNQMAEEMTHFSNLTPYEIIGNYVSHLARRINLLQARLSGGNLATLRKLPQPSYQPIEMVAGQKIIPEVTERFENLYIFYLNWQTERSGLNQEMNDLTTWLEHILNLGETHLGWLVSWANQNPDLDGIYLEDFWGDRLRPTDEIKVGAAFTIPGTNAIFSFLEEIETALYAQDGLKTNKYEFKNWFKAQYIQSWENFSASFPMGADLLADREAWQEVAARIGANRGPYFALLERMAAELQLDEHFSLKEEEFPPWLKLVFIFEDIKDQAARVENDSSVPEAGILEKATRKVKSKISKLEKKTGIRAGNLLDSKSNLIAVQAMREYQNALTATGPAAVSREAAFKMATALYKEDPAVSESPYFSAWKAINALKFTMSDGKSDPQIFWQLVRGPLDFYQAYISREAECQLQDLWEKDVLVKVQGVSDAKTLNQVLFGQTGYAIKFVEGPGSPFVEQSLDAGYYAKSAHGGTVTFDDAFFTFLEKGADWAKPRPAPKTPKSNYRVSIKGIPTDVNQGAKAGVHHTRLELSCGTGALQTLDNWNDYKREIFNWSPEACGDVVLKIEVADLILYREYTGAMAFANFLNDFKTGQRNYRRRDFSEEQQSLKRLGIENIKVRYDIHGHSPVIKLLGPTISEVKVPGPPRYITQCWDQ
jgi:type VI secretion system protein ImpL